jgi:PAS domain S-box-containing protein
MGLEARNVRLEAQRAESEQFRLLIESVLDYAIFMLDPDGYIVTWNPGALRIKGYTAAEAIGMHFSRFYPPEALADRWPEYELEQARLHGRFEDEGWRLRKDGTRFWANVMITSMTTEDGVLRGFVKVTRDMTERRRALAIEASQQRVDEFIAMLGHELRNPLGVIQNTAAMIRRHSAGELLEKSADMLTRQVTHLSRLVDDLLDVGRIRSGKLGLRESPMELGAMVREAVQSVMSQATPWQHELELKVDPHPLQIVGDHLRLLQAVANIVGNAVKYTPAGGSISVRMVREGRDAVISVRDTGVGITPDLLQEIFAPFSQGHRTIDRAAGGLGIGLTIAKRIVELHGGSLIARSEGVNMGSEFIIRLPLRQPALGHSVGSGARVSAVALGTTGNRVLVVDDNHDAADSLAMLIKLDGHEVEVVYSGADALSAFEQRPADVVVLDIGLPGMDGYEVAERLRGLAGDRSVTLIALTGYGQDKDRARSQDSGFNHHLVKPVEYDSLRGLLAQKAQR